MKNWKIILGLFLSTVAIAAPTTRFKNIVVTGGITGNVTGALYGNASTATTAVTATALASNPTDCAAGQYAASIDASGNLTCAAVTTGQLSGSISQMQLQDNIISNAKLSQVATATFKGRVTGGTGDVEDLTGTQATTLLSDVVGDSGSGGTKGLVPAPASGDAALGKFLRADGTFAVPAGSAGGAAKNFVTNPSGATTANNWTLTNGSGTGAFVRDTNAATGVGGTSNSLQFIANGSGDYVTSDSMTLDNDVTGNCQVNLSYMTSAAVYSVNFVTGSSVLNTLALPASATYRTAQFNYPCTTGGAIKITASGAGAAINYGNAFYGAASNLAQLNQATKVGAAYFANTASCTWTKTGAIGPFNTTAACPGPTVEVNTGPGVIQTTDTNLPEWTVNGLPPGDYTAFINTEIQSSTSDTYCLAVNDGTDTRGNVCFNPAASVAMPVSLTASFTYTGTANRTFKIYGSAGGTLNLHNEYGSHKTQLILHRNPTAAELAVNQSQNVYPTIQKLTSGSGTYTRPSGVSWIKVRMVGGGSGGAGGGTSTPASTAGGNTTFGASLLVANGGAAATQVGGIGGSASITGVPIGTALAGGAGGGGGYSGSASGKAGGMGAATPFGGAGGGGAGNTTAGTAAIANTGSGGGGGGNDDTGGTASGGGGGAGGYVEAIINTPDATYAYAVGSGGAGGSAGASGAGGGAGGSGYIEVTEYYGSMNAPILVGSVTSQSLGAERIERLKITNSTSVSSQSGSWASVSNTATGRAGVTITANVFSSTPMCTCTSAAANNAQSICQITGLTSSSFEARTRDSTTGGLVNEDAYITCVGPK